MLRFVASLLFLLVVACSSSASSPDGANDCTALPGDPCASQDAQCFTNNVTGGAWLRCCNGKWFEEQGAGADAAQFTCP